MPTYVEVVDVTCPASTPVGTPLEINLKLRPGSPRKVTVVIPDGHAGVTGIALALAHQPVLPMQERGTVLEALHFLEGNDEHPEYDLEGYPETGAWSVFVFNEDVNAHSWQLRFEIGDVPLDTGVGTAAPPVLALTPAGEVAATPAPGAGVSEGEAPALTQGSGEAPAPEQAQPETPPPPTPAPAPESEAPEPVAPAPPPEEGATFTPPPEGAPPPEEGEAGTVPGEGAPAVAGAPARTQAPRPTPRPGRPRTVLRVTHETRPAGGWLPHGARFEVKQTDQGQDFITNWRGKLIAPAGGYVVRILSDRPFPSGFGPHYAVVHIDSGRWGGHDWYLGHATATVRAGERFAEGHELALADQGYREGGGWVELGEAPGGYPAPMGAGAPIAHLFAPLQITRSHVVTVRTPPKKPPEHREPAHEHYRPPESRRAPVAPAHHAEPPPHAPAPQRRPAPPPAHPAPPYHPPPPRPPYHPPPPRPRPPARRR